MTLSLFDRKAPPPTCFECDHVAEHRHHVVPRSLGGTRTVWLCTACHSKAHHMAKNPWVNHKTLIIEGKKRAYKRNPKLKKDERKRGAIRAADNKRRSDNFALSLAPYMQRLEDRGFRTLMEKTHEMNRAGVPTPGGKQWHISTVHRLLKRLERLEAELAAKREAA